MLTLQVKEKEIENLTPEKEFIRGTVGAICQVNFEEFWQPYEKWVVFKRNGCEPIKIMVHSLTNEIEIPPIILAESGEFQIGVFGVTETETLPTLYSNSIKIRYGTDTNGTIPPKYTPSEIDQLRLSKQDKLTAGDGISISENNVISATGGSGAVDDVQINGESIVDEGVANIPIDQTYNANSLNAQSGKAVAEAVSNCVHKVKGNGHTYRVYAVGDLNNEYNECTLTVENNSHFVSDIDYGEIPRRQDNGNIMTNTPITDLDCANKKYVDDIVGNIETLLGGI